MSRYNNAAELAAKLTTSQQEVADLRWPTTMLIPANDVGSTLLRSRLLAAHVSLHTLQIHTKEAAATDSTFSCLCRNALEAAAAVHLRDVALLHDLQPKPVSIAGIRTAG
jgi:hypothetical protein